MLSHGRLELSHGRLKSARCALQTRCKGITPGVKATRDRETPSPSSPLAVSPRPSRRAIRALAPSRAQRPFLVRPRGVRGGRRLQISTRFQTSIDKSKQNGQAMGAGRRGFTSLSPPRPAPTPRPTSKSRRYQAACTPVPLCSILAAHHPAAHLLQGDVGDGAHEHGLEHAPPLRRAHTILECNSK